MAAATAQLSKDQFHCSICLNEFMDPVTLPCGHNFCKKCIEMHWSIQAKLKCPVCKKTFLSRPELKINTLIAKMADKVKQSQVKTITSSEPQVVSPGEVLCDVCTGPKQPAIKSCLVCLSSYCESHLEPHLNTFGLRKHQLLEPKKDLEERVCKEHDKPLELFCQRDRKSVCALCMDSSHKNHHTVTLKEASEQQRLRLLTTEDSIQKKITNRMKKIDELRGSVKVSDAAADKEISDGIKVFNTLKQSVDTGLDRLISELTKKKISTEQLAEGLIQDLEQEIRALEKSGAEVKLLSKSDDPLHLLQSSSKLSPEPSTRDWTCVTVPVAAYEGAVERALTDLEQDFNKTTKSMFKPEAKRVTVQEEPVPTAAVPLKNNRAKEKGKSSSKSKKNKKIKSKKKKKKLTAADIGTPSNFQHIGHVAWNPVKGFDLQKLDSEQKSLMELCGIKEVV